MNEVSVPGLEMEVERLGKSNREMTKNLCRV